MKILKAPSLFNSIGEITTVLLDENFTTIIDTEDLPKIVNYRWYPFHTKWGVYAAAMYKENGKRRQHLMHRLITGAPKDLQIDHEDHNGLNNRKKNLRICTNKQNGENRKSANKNSKNGIRGVHFWNSTGIPYWKVQVASAGVFHTKVFPHTDEGLKQAIEYSSALRQRLFTHSIN